MKQHIHLYDAVTVPFESVRRLLRDHPDRVLCEAAAHGEAGVEESVTALELDLAGFRVAKEVELEVLSFADVPGRVPRARVQLRWEPVDHSHLFPSIEADLEAEPVEEGRSMLSLLGIYRPPLGAIGVAVDKVVLHHVAETAMRRFFHHLLHRIKLESDRGFAAPPPDEPSLGIIERNC